MEQLMWKVIEESKAGKEYCNSEEQYQNLLKVLGQYDKATIKAIYEEWNGLYQSFSNNPEFNKLHWSKGGIVNAGDDGFYMDFGNWFVAQGEELYNEFKERGHQAVLDYVKKHNLDESEYRYECMIYAFHQFD
jgi:Protein of unknown function (DUF4240)